ncbi:hypothetical protein HAX54_036896, partial [Datura stramonium]|nr:hypothetical protein [Datura stramonium]
SGKPQKDPPKIEWAFIFEVRNASAKAKKYLGMGFTARDLVAVPHLAISLPCLYIHLAGNLQSERGKLQSEVGARFELRSARLL